MEYYTTYMHYAHKYETMHKQNKHVSTTETFLLIILIHNT